MSLFFRKILWFHSIVEEFIKGDSHKVVDQQKGLFTELLVVCRHSGGKKSLSTGGIMPEIEKEMFVHDNKLVLSEKTPLT